MTFHFTSSPSDVMSLGHGFPLQRLCLITSHKSSKQAAWTFSWPHKQAVLPFRWVKAIAVRRQLESQKILVLFHWINRYRQTLEITVGLGPDNHDKNKCGSKAEILV